VLLDEKYDRAFGIKIREAGEVFIVLYLFFFFFIVLLDEKI
jgi:hypothetical protein